MEESLTQKKSLTRSGQGHALWLSLAALTPAWCAMAWLVSKAQWFWNHRPDLQFGWVVLILCGYLLWEAWEQRPPLTLRGNFWVVVLGATGLSLLFLVQIYQAAFGMNAATLTGTALGTMLLVAANLNYAFGLMGVRHFGFGFAFLLIALPMPSSVHAFVVNGLQAKVATMNVEVLNLIGIPAQQVGSLIQLPNCTVGIDEACSGIRSLQSTVMATLFIGYLTLKNRALQVLLLGSGIGLAIFGNLVRSFFLSYTANSKGTQVLEAYHDSAGWSILAFTAVGVMVMSWLFHKLEAHLAGELPPPPAAAEA